MNDARSARGGGGNSLFSLRAITGYLRIVSSGASNVASTVRSAGASVASTIADRDSDSGRDQVHWAGFDKLECEGGVLRQVLLLGYRYGFQVWDVEEGDDVRQLVARYDGPVSCLQMQKMPIASKRSQDKFANVRPLLVSAVDESSSVGGNDTSGNDSLLPTSIFFYSLRIHEYVRSVKLRSPVYSIRCSSRVVAVSQATQIHCYNAATLENDYTIVTFPIAQVSLGSGGIGCGPLALGSRWLAYSGTPVEVSSTGRVSPQHLPLAMDSFTGPSNGSLVAHYAKESSKQIAAGFVTLGDMGYKKLSKYCSEFIPDNNSSMKHRSHSLKTNGIINGNLLDADNIGTVIVRDIVSKSVVVQFRAHQSPISALAFDPSGILLVTASIHGHNINVFRIIPSLSGSSSDSDATGTSVYLYRLQRGITNAVIQDISFSDDSQWIMISSSRGTSHLFSISPYGGSGDLESLRSSAVSMVNRQNLFPNGTPITLSVVGRIKNGSNGWKGAVSGAAAAAAGKISPLYGAIASTFHKCKDSGLYPDMNRMREKYYLLVFSPTGSVIQYVLRHTSGEDSGIDLSGLGTVSHGSLHETDSRLVVEALQKWDVCQKRNRRDRGDHVDVYGEHGSGENTKVFQKAMKRGTGIYPEDSGSDRKVNDTIEENNHVYISEIELLMHSYQVPLWANSKINFQVMVGENGSKDYDSALGGEIEIERIPARTIEARTKDPIPVFDYHQPHRLGPSRSNSGISEDGRRSCRSSCSSLDYGPESAAAASKLPSGFSCGDLNKLIEANEGVFVNNSMNKPNMKNQLEAVHKMEGLMMEAQLEHVNTKESLKMENYFEGYDNEID